MPGVIAVGHGWGSTVYEPNSGQIAQRYGSNRNALVDRHAIDRFSQVPHFNSTAVRVELIAAETEQASLIAAAQA